MEVIVGVIVRAHGIRGEVVVESRTDDPDARFAPGAVLRSDSDAALTVVSARQHRGRLIVRFAEIADRTAAERWRGRQLLADVADEAPADDADEYYDQQLAGLTVVTEAGAPVGTVKEVLHHPAQDLLVVQGPSGEVLLPFVAQIVTVVDIPGGRLVVAPPPGLLGPADTEQA